MMIEVFVSRYATSPVDPIRGTANPPEGSALSVHVLLTNCGMEWLEINDVMRETES